MKRFLHLSIPKAGTHLTGRIFSLHPDVRLCETFPPGPLGFIGWEGPEPQGDEPWACNGIARPCPTPLSWFAERLDAIGPGERLVCAHLPYSDALLGLLREREFALVLTVRHPCAVVLSAAHYLWRDPTGTVAPEANPEAAQVSGLDGPTPEFVEAVLRGLPPQVWPSGRMAPWRGVVEQFQAILGWLPHALLVRYEDLVGPRGGGSATRQEEVIREVLRHIGAEAGEAAVAGIVAGLYGDTSTFRAGQAEAWRRELPADLQAELCERMGVILRLLGYGRRARRGRRR